jgi:hypothetical protein
VQVATFNGQTGDTAPSNAPVTVKPFEQRELHGTVTICPEFKTLHQAVTQK